MKYVYTVWFVDHSRPLDDQDHEWPAVFIIDGRTSSSARDWGDVLARNYVRRAPYTIKSSHVEEATTSDLPGLDRLPVIAEGHEATNEEIGW